MIIVNKPKVTIAGAGGGKTHEMITEIIKILPILKKHPEKFCVVITYTNSATKEIKKRISTLVGIPRNLHISTTHSFSTTFIIEPYAHLLKMLPIDKNYIDKVNLHYKSKNFFAERASCGKLASDLSKDKGVIIYDKILEIAHELISSAEVCAQVSNRLAYIFVDEYQDMRLYQHQIFQAIVNKGKSNFFCIGDPLQSIFNFSYGQSQLLKEPKPKSFKTSPLLELYNNNDYEKKSIKHNNRCSNNIINFINHFNKVLNYEQELPNDKKCNNIPIFFITGNNNESIIEKYNQILSKYKIGKDPGNMYSLYLSKDWRTVEDIENVSVINNDEHSIKSIFKECSRCVLSALGINKREFYEILTEKDDNVKYMLFRQFCFAILKDSKDPNIEVNSDYIFNKFKSTFNVTITDDKRKNIDISKSLLKLNFTRKPVLKDIFCSTIHSAKGLESTNVLVFAKTNNQLLKWIDFNNVTHDTDDEFRLGYVAFSRARELLCITSLEQPSKKLLDAITAINVEIV